MRKFQKRIKELREDMGISQNELARRTGISNASISRWENGIADIASDYLVVLCKFFGVSADYLLGLED